MGNKQSDESSWLSWFVKKPAHVKKLEKKLLKNKPQPSSDDSSSSSSEIYYRKKTYDDRFKDVYC